MATKQAFAVNALPPLVWRSLAPVPCISADYDFAHDQVRRMYAYVDGASHDWTGRQPLTFSTTLLFLNTLEPDLYPKAWADWREALFDGTIGTLKHPDLGPLQARVLSGSVKLSGQSTAGVTVQVTWEESRDDIDDGVAFSGNTPSLEAVAKQADKDAAKLGFVYPTGKNEQSLEELINSVNGAIFSAQLTISGGIRSATTLTDKVVGAAVGTVRQIRDNVQKVNDTAVWALDHNLETLENGLLDTLELVTILTRPILTKTTTAETSLDAFAKSVNNTLGEVMGLNVKYIVTPTVPRGVTLSYFGTL